MGAHHRLGFIIIFGWKVKRSSTGVVIRGTCPECYADTTLHGQCLRRWFTLFFIPVIPMDTVLTFTVCARCNAMLDQSPHEAHRLAQFLINQSEGQSTAPTKTFSPPTLHKQLPHSTAAATASRVSAASSVFAPAIALHNQLRDSPDDSEKLHRLLQMYLELKEPGEAVSAGKAFGGALEKSDACMVLMAEACMAVGDREKALLWAMAATALNSQNARAGALRTELFNHP